MPKTRKYPAGQCAKCGSSGPFYASCKSWCKACRVQKSSNYYRRPGGKEESRAWRLMRVYGLTPKTVTAMRKKQNDECAICHARMVKPIVDHCHSDGHVRGLLCSQCNTALGLFKDNPVTLLSAHSYLTQLRIVSAKKEG